MAYPDVDTWVIGGSERLAKTGKLTVLSYLVAKFEGEFLVGPSPTFSGSILGSNFFFCVVGLECFNFVHFFLHCKLSSFLPNSRRNSVWLNGNGV